MNKRGRSLASLTKTITKGLSMNKFNGFLVSIMLSAGVYAADANQMKYVQMLPPNVSTNLSVTGDTIDIANYKGNAALVVETATSSAMTNTITVTLQHSTASNFANPTTVTNLAGTAGVLTETCTTNTADTVNIQTYPIDTARLHKYIRVIYTTTMADAYIPVSALFVAPMKAE
jgi:hypothetical protein